MWRRTYLFLVLVRLWFALSPSYLHPDENFQGPEVIAGMQTFSPAHSRNVIPLCAGGANLAVCRLSRVHLGHNGMWTGALWDGWSFQGPKTTATIRGSRSFHQLDPCDGYPVPES